MKKVVLTFIILASLIGFSQNPHVTSNKADLAKRIVDKTTRYHPTFPSMRDPAKAVARPVPSFLHGSVMYQLFPRMFTREGTINAARKMLPHIKSLGVDIIYMCPVFLSDDDKDKNFWSGRQKASKLGNPKNPYRIKDFFSIDPEYGRPRDLKAFVNEAHALGMKVMFDLVYFHCGPKAVFLEEHPDFIVRNADGSPMIGDWKFPELNIANQKLREYLYSNMVWLLKEFNVDGFRCDVADMLPVDFWEEAYKRVTAVKPDCFLMCEGLRGDDQHSAFDLSYGFYTQWAIGNMLRAQKPATEIRIAWKKERIDYPKGFHWMRCFDNHDFAMDSSMHGGRFETIAGEDMCEAMLATIFMLDGVPMIYNGQEIADNAPHSIFSNRYHGRMGIDWARALTADGTKRQGLIKSLTSLRHKHPDLFDAPLNWFQMKQSDDVYAFKRTLKGGKLMIVVNIAKVRHTVELPKVDGKYAKVLASDGFEMKGEKSISLPQKSFAILEVN